MTTTFLLTLCLLAEAPPQAGPGGDTLLVLPLVPTAGMPPDQAGLVTGSLAAGLALGQARRVLVFREVQDRFTPEQVQAAAACAAVKCAGELAAVVGAEQVVLGDVGRLGDSYVLNVQRVDTRRAEVVARVSVRAEGERVDRLLDEMPRVARRVAGATAEREHHGRDDDDDADDDEGDDGDGDRWTFGRVTALALRLAGLTCFATVPLPLLLALALAAAGTVTSAIFGLVINDDAGRANLATNPTFLVGFVPTMVASVVVGLFFVLPLAMGLALVGGSFLVN